MTTPRLQLGAAGEAAAEAHLRRLGYSILARNLRLGRLGELDIVAQDKSTLVFVEVKSRRSGDGLGGFGNITHAKQRKLTLLAQAFLQRHTAPFSQARFDAVEVEFAMPGDPRPIVRHLPDAFRAV
jgi:putative endonuclease